jgi:transcriptional repressor NrdR
MKCPFCQSTEHKVIDKREGTEGNCIRRRRECLSCQKRFTTYERIDLGHFFVIKKDAIREPFDREKIRRGILRAIEKRPVPVETVNQIVERIESKIRSKYEQEIDSRKIGNMIIRELKKTDKVAYIRFASVYKDFGDLDDFKKELERL